MIIIDHSTIGRDLVLEVYDADEVKIFAGNVDEVTLSKAEALFIAKEIIKAINEQQAPQ